MADIIKYDGNEPFVFISYSHKDNGIINEIFERFNLHRCRFWYDDNIHLGVDWSEDIATHINNAECVLLFISKNSINSDYVKDELHVARTLKKPIIPVYLEDVKLPLGLELSLGRAQSIYLKQERDIKKLCNTIVNNLPEKVIDSIAQPFFVDGDTTYYFGKEATYRAGENCDIIHNFKIYSHSETDDKEIVFYKFEHQGVPWLTDCDLADIHVYRPKYASFTCILVTLKMYFYAPYPLDVPDYALSMTFAIYLDKEGLHSTSLLNIASDDWRYLDMFKNGIFETDDSNDRPIFNILKNIKDSFSKVM